MLMTAGDKNRGTCQVTGLTHERILVTQGMKVLVVADQPRARQSLKALLSTWPMAQTIWEATNGKEALAFVQESPPDLVLMDSHMPEMDGLEATRRIKAKWPEVKIILLSVHAEYMAVALDAGADAFVCKCEPPEVLLTALEQVVKDK